MPSLPQRHERALRRPTRGELIANLRPIRQRSVRLGRGGTTYAHRLDPYVAPSRGQQATSLSHISWRTCVAGLLADQSCDGLVIRQLMRMSAS